MSYISAIRVGEDVLVWERTEHGRDLKTYRAPYYFYTKDKRGTYTSMYGDTLTRHDFDNSREFFEARRKNQDARTEMFESDIPAELRILSQHYYNVPAPKLHVTFLDIEVDYVADAGFASVENPYAPVNSIALYHSHQKRMIVIAVPPPGFAEDVDSVKKRMDEIAALPTDVQVDIVLVKDERELLLHVLYEIQDSDVLCGWNSDFFDVPYLGKRLEKYGKRQFRMLSFPEAEMPKWREVETEFRKNTTLDLSGRISVDYLVLFRKYEMEQRPSYKLAAIADELLPHLPKLEYEGSLASLYQNDFVWFIRYNLRDTEILKGFEERLGYVDLANQMCHLSCGLFTHVIGTLKLAELAVINYCHHELNGLIVNDMKEPEIDKSIQGAYVLYPRTGMHEWIGSIDINSLYPSSIRSINISPETLRGQFVEEIQAAEEIAANSDRLLTLVFDLPDIELGKEATKQASWWREWLKGRKYAVSGYGTVFDQNKQGIVPAILENWYATRKKYQKLKGDAKKEGDKIKELYYDKLQYTYKIKLNSFYGALTNLYFRFYDLRMGESTTGTGRMILKHQCRKVAQILEGNYNVEFPQYSTTEEAELSGLDKRVALNGPVFNGKFMSEAVIYGDTDSTYFNTFAQNKEEAITIADLVAEKVNKSYPKFMRDTFLCTDGFDNIIKAGREIVSDRGIFVDKKRYILHLVDLDGNPVDKMKVMGLETKKTILPKWVSVQLNSFIERYLKGESWEQIELDIVAFKDKLMETKDIMSIGLPKGVNGVEEYTQNLKVYGPSTRIPGHVNAAIFYNKCLEEFDDKESPPIVSGMKIKVFYLTKVIGKFKSIAIPVDIEQVPNWFLEEFEVDRDAHIERLVDKPLQNILKAINKQVPSKQSLLVDSVFEF